MKKNREKKKKTDKNKIYFSGKKEILFRLLTNWQFTKQQRQQQQKGIKQLNYLSFIYLFISNSNQISRIPFKCILVRLFVRLFHVFI